MNGFLNRLTQYFDRTAERAADTAPRRPTLHAADKIEGVRAYAEFCRTGVSPAYPLEIFLEISNICDLKCAMCVQFSALNAQRLNQIKRTPRGFMDQGEISENIEQALRHALLVHCFGYGEPTIHPTFRSFLDLISRYEVMIDFFTNGMHLDEEFCRFLVDRRVFQITVSFSGATKETYESIYLGGDFERVLGGLKRLADIKKETGSRFPIIEINSLGFRDHVAKFDDFVTLMADHGADVVMLKPLHAHKTIPELFEHVSIMRPEQEGEVVKRALRIGRQRGIQVNASLYMTEQAANAEEYADKVDALKEEAERAFAETGRKFGDNPVSRFGALADELEPIRGSGADRRPPKVLSLDSPPDVAGRLLRMRAQDKKPVDEPFHCMEPFKTLYLSRNGAAKPCCFANPESWYFGDAKQDDALAIWKGNGFEMTREGIAKGDYPMRTCEVCLRRKSGPQDHLARPLLDRYLDWHRQIFDGDLRRRLDAELPGAYRLLARSPAAIMAEARQRQPADGGAAGHWPPGPATMQTESFAATARSFVHRDFLPPEDRAARRRANEAAPDLSPDLLPLLETCGRRFAGTGCIVDLGLPGAAMTGLLAGLAANPAIDSIAAPFAKGNDRLVERFAAADEEADAAEPHPLVRATAGDLAKIRWLATKPIGLCLVNGRGRDRLVQRALRQLLPAFVPGETIVVQADFYHHTKFYPKLLMGYLGGSFEWLGQVGLHAVFRFVRPVPADLAELDPYPGLPTELCLHFHRQWAHGSLPRQVQVRLELSYARLLSAVTGQDAALAHIDAMDGRSDDDKLARLVAATRRRLAETAPAA